MHNFGTIICLIGYIVYFGMQDEIIGCSQKHLNTGR